MTNHYETIRAALEGARTTARICVLGGLAKETDDALSALAELERAASEPVAYQYAHPYFGGAKIWREEQRWNGHTSDESRALYPAPPIPKGMFTAEESALSAAIAAAPQPQVGVTDEMCSRVWLSKFPQYQHAGDLQREMAMSWLKAWQSELGPALGMVAWREPTPEECVDIIKAYYDTPVDNFGRAMFDAVRAVMWPKEGLS